MNGNPSPGQAVGRVTRRRGWRVGLALLAAGSLAASCTASDDDDDAASDTPTTTAAPAGTTTSAAPDPGTDGSTTTAAPLTASAPGVTEDTIRIGVAYIDLAALAESGLIRLDWGPVEDMARALVDDVNANGGINGRMLEVSFGPYLPIGNEQSLAACTKLTEDDGVFAVLGGFLADNNLCVVEQHDVALVSAFGMNDERLARAQAPWASTAASDERALEALVQLLDQGGQLDGDTVGIYATPVSQSLGELAQDRLEAAGYSVGDLAVMDAPLSDLAAVSSQNRTIAQRMADAGVTSVIIVRIRYATE